MLAPRQGDTDHICVALFRSRSWRGHLFCSQSRARARAPALCIHVLIYFLFGTFSLLVFSMDMIILPILMRLAWSPLCAHTATHLLQLTANMETNFSAAYSGRLSLCCCCGCCCHCQIDLLWHLMGGVCGAFCYNISRNRWVVAGALQPNQQMTCLELNDAMLLIAIRSRTVNSPPYWSVVYPHTIGNKMDKIFPSSTVRIGCQNQASISREYRSTLEQTEADIFLIRFRHSLDANSARTQSKCCCCCWSCD